MKNASPDVNFGSNAMVTDKDGSILLTRMAIGTIERMDDKGNLKPFLSNYQGKRLNSPNDLVFTKDGALWITDPSFGLPKMDADPKKQLKYNRGVALRRRQADAGDHRHDPAQRHRLLARRARRSMSPTPCPTCISAPMTWAPDGKLSNPRKLISYPGSRRPMCPTA